MGLARVVSGVVDVDRYHVDKAGLFGGERPCRKQGVHGQAASVRGKEPRSCRSKAICATSRVLPRATFARISLLRWKTIYALSQDIEFGIANGKLSIPADETRHDTWTGTDLLTREKVAEAGIRARTRVAHRCAELKHSRIARTRTTRLPL